MYEEVDRSKAFKKLLAVLIIIAVLSISVLIFGRLMGTGQTATTNHPSYLIDDNVTIDQLTAAQVDFLTRLECERTQEIWASAFMASLRPNNRRRTVPGNSLSMEDALTDFYYIVTDLRRDFPYLGFACRQLGIELDVLELQVLEAIYKTFAESTTGNIHYSSFRQLINNEFMQHFQLIGHLWALSPDHFTLVNPNSHMPIYERVQFESIEADKIAYISVISFSVNEELHQEISDAIASFYMYISDYEHLIIDVRGNGGGLMSFFFDELILPLMTEDYTHVTFSFATNRAAASRWVHNWVIGRTSFLPDLSPRSSRDIIPIGMLLERYGHELRFLHPDDKAAFNYGFRNAIEITAPRQMDENGYEIITPVFDGKVWLLIDGGASATVEIAHRVQEMGLASLVGNTTGGATGRGREYVRLPRSGIWLRYDALHMTDRHGRSSEYGVEPHIFSDDALGTVLQLIESGEYRYIYFTLTP